MTPDLDALERAARAATPGPWEVDGIDTEGEYGSGDDTASGYVEYGLYTAEGHQIVSTEYRAGELSMISEEYDDDGGVIAWNELARRDALFLAAANPAAILSLIARLRTAEAALAGARDELDEAISTEQTDWHDEVAVYGVDPNCYGAGRHAGLVEGLERARAWLSQNPAPAAKIEGQ